ncbi:YbhB/YbcL family Raf kinase inhibitor-like protein [Murinocardiopsis flavida]|uniref:YbhB/YbcL family Raf kinase inhibitor-like protein n=1 Tax=Murinocardiopsis flavida TaxID=645275 RepID=UPI001FE4998D|nr:YbhB/YbcL family Raf kinase inhibitor-like protein [Murinocardiopsis flavida]
MCAAVGALVLAAPGCGVLSPGSNGQTSDDITVTSTMIREGEAIPARFTCKGEGVSPPLRWSGLPDETESLAIIVDDPESVGGAAVHWVLYGLDPENPELPEGTVPQNGKQGQNSKEQAAYDPPCPSGDTAHEFRFTVYALKADIALPDGAPLDQALGAVASNTLARGRLIATGGR